MPYPVSNAPSDATKGSTHSSAIMIIPDLYEYNHPPLSTMGTPTERPETPASTHSIQPSSRNQVMPYRNAPGELTVPGSANQSVPRDQITPYQSAPSETTEASSRQPPRTESDRGTDNAVRWVAEQQALRRDNRSPDSIATDSIATDSTVRPPQTQPRRPGHQRSRNSWVAPMLVLGAAAVLANVRIGESSHSRRPDRDREHDSRPSHRYRAPTYGDDDSDDDAAGRSSRRQDHARDGHSHSHRSRRSHNHDRDEDRRRSGR